MHWHENHRVPQHSPASATNHKSSAFNLKRFLTAGKFFCCFKSILPCSSWQQFESQWYAVCDCATTQMQDRIIVTILVHILQFHFGEFSRSFSFRFVASFSMTLLFCRYVDNIIMLPLAAATYGVLCHMYVCCLF